ncbi:MAG: apolipoprotein N-acyltransferase [Myxococcales bacterium]|nr:apolipoprotein N-acyltransferase [Myxococcales bacterium]
MKLVRPLVAVLAGLLLAVEAPPVNLHLLQWVGLVPMLAMMGDTRRDRRLGLLYGAVATGAIYAWIAHTIVTFSNLPMPVAVLILGLFSVAFGSPYAVLWGSVAPLRERLGSAWVLAWPSLWVLLEWTMSKVFLFPFAHGAAQYRVPLTWQIVGITGVWAVTWLVFFANAVLGEWIFRLREGDREPPGRWALLFSALLFGTVLYGRSRYEAVEAGLREASVVRFAQLQSQYGMEERFEMGAQESFMEWARWMEAIPPGVVDLVVLPEGGSPYMLNERPGRVNRARQMLMDLADAGDYDLIVGAGAARPDGDRLLLYNTVFAFGADGKGLGAYDKMVPLPFGEYLPLGEYLPGLADLIGGIGDFRAGTEPVLLPVAGMKVAAPICYEAILSGTCRSFDAPDLFVNVTNDAWFGDTAETHQHGMLAATRATELGIPLLRSTYSGVSFVVEPHGHIYAETGNFQSVQRLVELRSRTFPTFYGRWGDWFVLLCAALLGGLVARGRR